MKPGITALLIVAFILSGCDKITLETMSVKKYISLLKSGSYQYIELPPFDPADIPELLKYAEEDQLIEHYPANPVSSLYSGPCRLGIYVLWTVESIRLCSDSADGYLFRFPTLNPILSYRAPDAGQIDEVAAHQAAAKAYRDWWNSNSNFQLIKNTDPLEATDYRWR